MNSYFSNSVHQLSYSTVLLETFNYHSAKNTIFVIIVHVHVTPIIGDNTAHQRTFLLMCVIISCLKFNEILLLM